MSFTEQVVAFFRNEVVNNYELEEDIINKLCNYVESAIAQVGVPAAAAAAGRARRAPAARRKKSGYNVFVRSMMSEDEGIKQLNHREKMAAIGARWKALSEDDKGSFNTLAKEENDTGADGAEGADATEGVPDASDK